MPASVQSVRHNQQGFAVGIQRQQTFVDPTRCTLCGRCVEVCPGQGEDGGTPIGFESRMALPGRAVIDKRQEPLCQANCPLGVNAQGYIALVRAGRYTQALELIRRDNVLPGICGRICTHPCERACRRADVDGALAIRDIKRFLADAVDGESIIGSAHDRLQAATRPETVAVIGSGPAGLAAAADLARQGVGVTIFEKEDQAGGLLRYGIGPHRLPRDILDRELDAIRSMGVETRDALDDTCLRAPFSGVVAKRHVENHQEVQAKAPIVFLQDLSQIEVVVDVPETLAAQIRKGYAPDVAARFACAQDKTFPLTLKEFSTKADPQTLTYQAVLVMPRPQGVSILPGMTATVDGRPKATLNTAPASPSPPLPSPGTPISTPMYGPSTNLT